MELTLKMATDIEGMITKCYASDNELLEKYHVCAPCSLNEAVVDTVEVLNDGLRSGAEIFELYADEFAGYFGRWNYGNHWIVGMFIMPKFRVKEFVKKFWSCVKSMMPGVIKIALYQKNIRAIDFVKKEGFEFDQTITADNGLLADIYILK